MNRPKYEPDIVKEGSFRYGDATGRVLIERSTIRWGTGDHEDEPDVRDDVEVETYYVHYESLGGRTGSSRSGACSTLAEAIAEAESAPGIGATVVWAE